jgi:hypothetical protein
MSKAISGVPESITREDYSALVGATGLDPRQITELSFRPDGIYAEVFYVSESGAKEADPVAKTFLKHSVYIPVVN